MKFASDEFLKNVEELDAQAKFNLDSDSLRLVLAGHAASTSAEAGQRFRPQKDPETGTSGSIEFKDRDGEPSEQQVAVYLKSDDTHLEPLNRGETETLVIKDHKWAEKIAGQDLSVMLVIRSFGGQIRWMNLTEYLCNRGVDSRQVVF